MAAAAIRSRSRSSTWTTASGSSNPREVLTPSSRSDGSDPDIELHYSFTFVPVPVKGDTVSVAGIGREAVTDGTVRSGGSPYYTRRVKPPLRLRSGGGRSRRCAGPRPAATIRTGFLRHTEGPLVFRVGSGHDTHRLVEGRPLILGGVRDRPPARAGRPHRRRRRAARRHRRPARGRRAGRHRRRCTPTPTRPGRTPTAGSFLQRTLARPEPAGWRPVNLDVTVFAQEPKLGPVEGGDPRQRRRRCSGCRPTR